MCNNDMDAFAVYYIDKNGIVRQSNENLADLLADCQVQTLSEYTASDLETALNGAFQAAELELDIWNSTIGGVPLDDILDGFNATINRLETENQVLKSCFDYISSRNEVLNVEFDKALDKVDELTDENDNLKLDLEAERADNKIMMKQLARIQNLLNGDD